MNQDQKIDLLKQTSLFSGLSGDDLTELSALAVERELAADEPVIWEGDSPDWFYVVASGKVKIVKYTSTGKDLIVAIFTPPGIFGEVAVFDGIPYPASATAVEKTLLLGIRRDDLLDYLRRNPQIALKIINLLGSRIRDAHDRLRDMAGERVDQRIAGMLLLISSKMGPSIPFTRQEIADMTGTTTETVIRTTTRLKDQGIISTGRGSISILDEARLRQISQGAGYD